MTATIAKIFIIITLGFEVLTATSGSAYYTPYAYLSAAILLTVITVNVFKKMYRGNQYRKVFASR